MASVKVRSFQFRQPWPTAELHQPIIWDDVMVGYVHNFNVDLSPTRSDMIKMSDGRSANELTVWGEYSAKS